MIVCICNGLRDKDIKNICDSCTSKDEFTECLNLKLRSESCLTCYRNLVENYEKKKTNE